RVHAFCKPVRGWVGITSIDETRVLTLETRFGGFGIRIKEALRQKHRFRHFGESGAQRSGMHEFGCRAKLAGILSRHFSNLSKSWSAGARASAANKKPALRKRKRPVTNRGLF